MDQQERKPNDPSQPGKTDLPEQDSPPGAREDQMGERDASQQQRQRDPSQKPGERRDEAQDSRRGSAQGEEPKRPDDEDKR